MDLKAVGQRIKIAREAKNLTQEDLSYGSLAKLSDDVRILLEVIGISPNGNFAHIDFDASTGEVLLAEEKIEHSNGESEWKEME